MTDLNKAALEAVSISPPAEPKQTLKERFKDPARWKKSISDVGVWFLFGGLLTTMLSMYSPGYPIVVGTSSITPGIYWLDRTAFSFGVGEYVTFPFKPAQDWLLERYGNDRIFTKLVRGVPGDTVYADENLRLKVCHKPAYGNDAPTCEDAGVAMQKDSLGRTLSPWVPANHHYTLRDNELWVYAPNPRSLDSRYYGPIPASSVTGKSSPVFLWK
jgi:type IV secretory pathway protease TraF